MPKHAVASLPKVARPAGAKVVRAVRRGGSLVAPVGIAAGIVTAANAARRQGSSIADAALYDGLDTAKSFAAYGAAQAAGTYALMRGVGMTAARAAPIANAGLMAYGAAEGAWEQRKYGAAAMAKGAAKGAWDYSLPGMMLDGAKDLWTGAKDYRQIQVEERTRFDQQNAHWQKGTPQFKSPSTGDTFKRTRRDPRSGKMITETVRKRGSNPDADIGIDPSKKSED